MFFFSFSFTPKQSSVQLISYQDILRASLPTTTIGIRVMTWEDSVQKLVPNT